VKLKKALVQVYTGCGKGKTTAAFGLALRARGAGLSVAVFQFAKAKRYSEHEPLGRLGIYVKQCGRGCFIKKSPSKKDISLAEAGLAEARKIIFSKKYDLVILDEINISLKLGLLKTREVISLIEKKPAGVELVLTGRYCPKSLFRHADLVTDMRCLKHPYSRGIEARKGIEY